jgi:DNA-binding transcriptional regulator LsrR (DeoR family)
MGDFLGVFLTPDGRLVEPYAPNMTVSHVPSTDLHELAKRDDTIVLLTTSGRHKAKLVRAIIEAGLCNALITDLDTACSVVGLEKQKDSDDIVERTNEKG